MNPLYDLQYAKCYGALVVVKIDKDYEICCEYYTLGNNKDTNRNQDIHFDK